MVEKLQAIPKLLREEGPGLILSPTPQTAQESPQNGGNLGLFGVSQRVWGICCPTCGDFGVQILLFEPAWARPWPVRRRRRRGRKGTHLDAVQRRHAHVEEDPVEHRHGNVLGTGKNHGPDPREGGSSFPGQWDTRMGQNPAFLLPCPQTSAGSGERECFTFRMGARKTEIPVSTKTMMPVTLCSLERGRKQGQPVLDSPSRGTTGS